MKKLNKKIILEFLDDEVGEPAAETPVVTEIPVAIPSEPQPLSEAEKKNFIITTLTDISAKALDFFNYLTPMMTIEVEDKTSVLNNLSEENKDLLRSIYEDVSLIVGKVTQALKDNTEENIQNAIDDGQTQAQETITPEVDLKEDLNSDKEKLWGDLMADVDMGDFFDDMQEGEEEEKKKFLKDPKKELQHWKEYYKENPEMLSKIKTFEDKHKEKLEEAVLKEAPDEYGLPTDDELNSEADRIRREYDQKIKDLYFNRDSKRKEIKVREFNEALNKLNSNPALEKLKNQIANNEILKFNATDEKSRLMAYSFGDGWITFSSDIPDLKYINIRLMLNDFKFNNELYEKKLDSQIKLLNLINDNLEYIIDLNKEKNEAEFKYNLTESLGATLRKAIGEKAFSKISKLSNVENGSHWAWGGRFMLFEYEGNLYHFEVYNDQVNIGIDERTPGLRLRLFNEVENKLGWYENPVIEKLGLKGFKALFPEAQIFQGYIIC